MNRSYRILPVYTGDVSGVASALYEMGGMVVIHDPSGCNSTYNTHDETRWYHKESLIFISGLKESDAVMGNDRKLIHDVVEAARQLQPAFIALTSSPIPYINGTDFRALCRIIEKETAIPTFYVKANGMHDYTFGAANAFAALAEKLLPEHPNLRKETPVSKHGAAAAGISATAEVPDISTTVNGAEITAESTAKTLNILGATPLDFWNMETIASLKQRIREMGWQVQSCWGMGDTPEQCLTVGCAAVNLVVSSVGLPLAEVLRERYGTPYVVGVPIGKYTSVLQQELENAAAQSKHPTPAAQLQQDVTANVRVEAPQPEPSGNFIVGEPVTMCSLAAALQLETGLRYEVLSPLESAKNQRCIPSGTDILCHRVIGEEGCEAFLQNAARIVADPLYRHICAPDTAFTDLPHLAFSGRCYRKQLRNLLEFL